MTYLFPGLVLGMACAPKWSPPSVVELRVPVEAASARVGTAVPVGRQALLEQSCADERVMVAMSADLLLQFSAEVAPEDVGTSTHCSVVLDRTGPAELDIHFVEAVADK